MAGFAGVDGLCSGDLPNLFGSFISVFVAGSRILIADDTLCIVDVEREGSS